jgi:hemerythrin
MLNELLDEARAMTLDQIAERVEALINGWFYQHILRVDAAYVPFLREAGKDAEAHGSA